MYLSVNEVAQYYLNNGSDAYIIMLDASKAFDRIEYAKLFTLLIERDICPMILRLLLCLYVGAQLRSQPILRWAIAQLRILSWVAYLKMG